MSYLRWPTLLLAGLFILTGIANAQEKTDISSLKRLEIKVGVILSSNIDDENVLSELRTELEAVQQVAVGALPEAQAKYDNAKAALDALGPPPEEGAEPEAEELAAQRKELAKKAAELNLKVKKQELALREAEELIDQVVEYRRERFANTLFSKGHNPIYPVVWKSSFNQFSSVVTTASGQIAKRVEAGARPLKQALPLVVLAIVAGIVIGFPIRTLLIAQIKREPTATPTYSEKVATAGMLSASHAVPGILSTMAGYFALVWSGLLDDVGSKVALATLAGLVGIVVTAAVSKSALAPRAANWRLINISDHAATRVVMLLTSLATAYAVKQTLNVLYDSLRAGGELLAVHNLAFGMAIAILAIAVSRKSPWQAPEPAEGASIAGPETVSRWIVWFGRVRWLIFLVALAIPVTALLGYRNMSEFIGDRLVITGGMLALLILFHLFAADTISRGFGVQSGYSHDGRKERGLSAFLLILCIDLILLFIAVLVLLPLWGATSDDLSSWINKALFGFRIGNVTISLTAIVIAVAIFGAILMVTRVLQHVLGERLLPMTGVDSGVRDSLRTALGYVGFIIAAAIGLSFAGVDLSQLAIVAGALSIGMGFGLQNVVNNFVSGLILLVERPIKVGDWIIAGAHQGNVKKINVRATEIETFDRSSVIVPNSELISAPVTNWFFKDRNGRVIVNVGVSYDADPEKVRDILIDIASTNPGILKKPSPSCHFVNFGDSSLDFSLRFFIRNIDYMMSIGSEVRYAIAKRFRGEGIEIPFPQREVNLRDIKQIAAALGNSE